MYMIKIIHKIAGQLSEGDFKKRTSNVSELQNTSSSYTFRYRYIVYCVSLAIHCACLLEVSARERNETGFC